MNSDDRKKDEKFQHYKPRWDRFTSMPPEKYDFMPPYGQGEASKVLGPNYVQSGQPRGTPHHPPNAATGGHQQHHHEAYPPNYHSAPIIQRPQLETFPPSEHPGSRMQPHYQRPVAQV